MGQDNNNDEEEDNAISSVSNIQIDPNSTRSITQENKLVPKPEEDTTTKPNSKGACTFSNKYGVIHHPIDDVKLLGNQQRLQFWYSRFFGHFVLKFVFQVMNLREGQQNRFYTKYVLPSVGDLRFMNAAKSMDLAI